MESKKERFGKIHIAVFGKNLVKWCIKCIKKIYGKNVLGWTEISKVNKFHVVFPSDGKS